MEFIIRKATEKDIEGIMQIMRTAGKTTACEDWFVADEEDTVRMHIEQNGYTIVAETLDGQIAGFFIVKEPDYEENLGRYLDFTKEQLEKVIIMDSAAVAPVYRGNHLQGKMLKAAEAYIDREKFRYAMCTVHPDNKYSLENMQRYGYEIKATARCYGGFLRNILIKEM